MPNPPTTAQPPQFAGAFGGTPPAGPTAPATTPGDQMNFPKPGEITKPSDFFIKVLGISPDQKFDQQTAQGLFKQYQRFRMAQFERATGSPTGNLPGSISRQLTGVKSRAAANLNNADPMKDAKMANEIAKLLKGIVDSEGMMALAKDEELAQLYGLMMVYATRAQGMATGKSFGDIMGKGGGQQGQPDQQQGFPGGGLTPGGAFDTSPGGLNSQNRAISPAPPGAQRKFDPLTGKIYQQTKDGKWQIVGQVNPRLN